MRNFKSKIFKKFLGRGTALPISHSLWPSATLRPPSRNPGSAIDPPRSISAWSLRFPHCHSVSCSLRGNHPWRPQQGGVCDVAIYIANMTVIRADHPHDPFHNGRPAIDVGQWRILVFSFRSAPHHPCLSPILYSIPTVPSPPPLLAGIPERKSCNLHKKICGGMTATIYGPPCEGS